MLPAPSSPPSSRRCWFLHQHEGVPQEKKASKHDGEQQLRGALVLSHQTLHVSRRPLLQPSSDLSADIRHAQRRSVCCSQGAQGSHPMTGRTLSRIRTGLPERQQQVLQLKPRQAVRTG